MIDSQSRQQKKLPQWKILPLDLHAGIVVAIFSAAYTAVVAGFRGLTPGLMSGAAFALLIGAFAIAGFVVGSVVAGCPDFGPSKRTALVRGFVAAIPLYAAGGLLFLPVDGWFSLLPLISVIAAGLVGPPIGIFMYRLHRRRNTERPIIEPGGELAWLKGEMLGSWTPLLLSIAVLGALGVGMRAVPEQVTSPEDEVEPPSLSELATLLPELRSAASSDSTDSSAWYELGFALTSMGDFLSAVECLDHVVALDSSSTTAWVALGRAAFYSGQMQLAARAYWNALRLDPSVLAPNGLDKVVLDAVLNSSIQTNPDSG